MIFKVKGQGHRVKFLQCNILVNTRINILQWILTKLGTYLVLKIIWNLLIFKVKGQGHQVKFLPCNILVNTRINILQWIVTKLGTCLVLKRIWYPIDFQSHRSKGQGHRVKFLGTVIRHALHCPCFLRIHA